jgi:hypothetical protein
MGEEATAAKKKKTLHRTEPDDNQQIEASSLADQQHKIKTKNRWRQR